MKSEAEHKFAILIKDMVENTNFEHKMITQLKAKGYDQIPEFEFIKEKNHQLLENEELVSS